MYKVQLQRNFIITAGTELLLLFIDSKTCGYMRVDHSLMSTLRQRLLLKTLPGQAGHDHAGLKTAGKGRELATECKQTQ